MPDKAMTATAALIIAILVAVPILVTVKVPKSHLGGCISLNLIKQQVNKSTLGTYCWNEDGVKYCIYRKDK